MKRREEIPSFDTILIALLPLVGAGISILLNTPYLISILLLYGAPGIYVTFRFAQGWQTLKAFLFASVTGIPFTIIVDYIGTESGTWHVPATLFPTRFLNLIPWEDFFWMFAATYTILICYEVFCDRGKREVLDQRMSYFILSALVGLSLFFFALDSANNGLFDWNSKYTYLTLGTVFFLLPSLAFLWRFPGFLSRSLAMVGYFLYLTVAFEITAAVLHQWLFTGKYLIPPIDLVGNSPIPYEEVFFVGLVGPLAVVALYEYFDDDLR